MNKIYGGQKIVKETEPGGKLCQLEFNFVAVGLDHHPNEDFPSGENSPQLSGIKQTCREAPNN